MKKSLVIVCGIVGIIGVFMGWGGKNCTIAGAAADPCKSCHLDMTSLLPQDHPEMEHDGLAACLDCHATHRSQEDDTNLFSARLHLRHLQANEKVECLACHMWKEGATFGLMGTEHMWVLPSREDIEIIQEIFLSWATSEFMDNLHAQAALSCSSCHGKKLPSYDATVANTICLACHGPVEQLIKKTEPAQFKDRNPHQSHLGEIGCTVCHKAHSESRVYCLGCHQKFEMKIKGAGSAKQQ